MKKKALFLDRDGVINYDYGYVYKIEHFKFKENIFEYIKKFKKKNYEIIIITNQAGIAKAKFSYLEYLKLHNYIIKKFKDKNIEVTIFFCPHHPNAKLKKFKKNCLCRKPKPGMLILASKLLKINLKKSIMIGDKLSDIKAGMRAGIEKNFLVKNIRLKKSSFKRYENLNQIYKIIS